MRVCGSLGVVFIASITREGEFAVSLGVAHEVGAVVKASITAVTQAVFVVVTFDVAFFFGEFEARFVLHGKHGGSGSGPVAGSVGSSHRSSFVCC